MTKKEKWFLFQEAIAERLHEIDPHAKSTKGSGNCGQIGDVNNNAGLIIECKQRNTDSITIKKDVWKKLCAEVPLHSDRIPIYALENKDEDRWAVLDLDTFLDIWVEYYQLKYGE